MRLLGQGAVDEDELYTALDWLAERQPPIEAALARRHLEDGTLVLYDVLSSYLEGLIQRMPPELIILWIRNAGLGPSSASFHPSFFSAFFGTVFAICSTLHALWRPDALG